MSNNLFDASRQWASRPADQRFWTLMALHEATKRFKDAAVTSNFDLTTVKVYPTDSNDIILKGKSGKTATFTNWSFGQLTSLIKSPAGYLAQLPAKLAADCLNHGIEWRAWDEKAHGLRMLGRISKATPDGGDIEEISMRSVTSDIYSRIWSSDVSQFLVDNCGDWITPPARPPYGFNLGDIPTRIATEDDCVGLAGHPSMSIVPGDVIAPAGLYASDEDCFIVLINVNRPVTEGNDPMFRGVIVSNSEVGKQKIRMKAFLFRHVCGNHIFWDVKNEFTFERRHVGNLGRTWRKAVSDVMFDYRSIGSGMETQIVNDARVHRIGPGKDAVVDKVFQKGLLTKKDATGAYVVALENDEDPRTVWGFVQGVTRYSQDTRNMDKRVQLDEAAGKILHTSF